MVFRVLPELRLIISHQNRAQPSDVEWERWFRAAEAMDRDTRGFRLLVFTEGGHPSRAQLDQIRVSNRGDPVTAIVSPSLALRVFGSALTFLNPSIRCFTPEQMSEACKHLGLHAGFADRANAVIVALRRQMGGRLA